MKCDQCGNEATVHDFKVLKCGIIAQVHLCETCAAGLGLSGKTLHTVEPLIQPVFEPDPAPVVPSPATPSASPSPPATASPIVVRPPVATSPTAAGNACPDCGLTWAEFREKQLLGCSRCYETFESALGPIVERAHEGGTRHVGRSPANLGEEIDIGGRVSHLRKQLAEALAAEHYERAAQLRDQIATLTTTTTVPVAAPTTTTASPAPS